MIHFKLLLTLLALVVPATAAQTIQATRNRLDCEESADGETIHCQFALERINMRKHLDTCIHTGKESFCVETKLHLIKRTLYGASDE
jgi:hypothetical protein